MVGARNASANGRRLARELAARARPAPGSSSSRAWRAASTPRRIWGRSTTGTVAVVAGGVDIVYPEENRGLYDALAARRARSSPSCRSAPSRRRAISRAATGSSRAWRWASLVVEAAARSGSLITARFALEQGREVFAVPGSPLDPRCRGANDLLRNGATLTETAEDVLAQLGPLLRGAAAGAGARAWLAAAWRAWLARWRRRRAGRRRGRARDHPRKAGADPGRG